MTLHKIRIIDTDGTNVEIFDSASRAEVHKRAKRALTVGKTVRWEDGSEEWHTHHPRIDSSKRGSDQYTWDRAGNKVLADVVRYVRRPGQKTPERTVMGTKYVLDF